MKVKACIYTDAGIARKVNQDSVLVKVARTKNLGRISFVAVCDGLGGLSKGEVASCKVIRALENWFHEELCLMQDLEGERLFEVIEQSWRRLIARVNGEIRRYGKHRRIKLGTTLTALLQIGTKYILMNIGDSRIYIAGKDDVRQLTKDQSIAQNVLLQCVGTSGTPEPEIEVGQFDGNSTVLACSDGFWKTMNSDEAFKMLCPQMCVTSEDMLDSCKKLAERAYSRNEEDNVSVAALCMEF
ncbi:serine/threonine-protein phosphatase [Butyrivibrio sp. XB500-5]|uniref:PP2C family protein-serine/threonine phosphatase n=1 Tax=Butyrivibrio sp. XB500-5 TaxID=2364880 RepID=UPI000EAA990E|nr:PP2C family serine/threonine-protein phosphatase [Butyrivibrio sp. XB500-5]RKM60235.1 serine/threonine-protein phosphatase [Butyrivibrio sp. XB500-5]